MPIGVAAPLAAAGTPMLARATLPFLGPATGTTATVPARPRAVGVLPTAARALPVETMRPGQRVVVRPKDAGLFEIGAARTTARFVTGRGPRVAAEPVHGPRHPVPGRASGKSR